MFFWAGGGKGLTFTLKYSAPKGSECCLPVALILQCLPVQASSFLPLKHSHLPDQDRSAPGRKKSI